MSDFTVRYGPVQDSWRFEMTCSVHTRANLSPGRVRVTGAGSVLGCRQSSICTGEGRSVAPPEPDPTARGRCVTATMQFSVMSMPLADSPSVCTEMILSNSHITLPGKYQHLGIKEETEVQRG